MNSIFLSELQQARRSGFLALTLTLGLLMGVFLLWIGIIEMPYHAYAATPLFALSALYYTALLLLIPVYMAGRFASQQFADDPRLNTPLSGGEILRGKYCLAAFLFLPLYLPTLPGQLFLLHNGTIEHFLGISLFVSISVSFSIGTVSILAGVRSTAGLLARVTALLFHAFGAISWFWFTFLIVFDIWSDYPSWISLVAIVLVIEIVSFWMASWYGNILLRPNPVKRDAINVMTMAWIVLSIIYSILLAFLYPTVLKTGLLLGPIIFGLYFGSIMLVVDMAAPDMGSHKIQD